MHLPSHISSLLYHHDCVIVPGFGGFVAKYVSARQHPSQHTFYPPAKTIAFNRGLNDNDGLLASHLAKKERISYGEAMKRIGEFVRQLNRSLNDDEVVMFPRIGKFYYDAARRLRFVPDRTANYLPEAFGLGEVQAFPVSREEKTEIMEQQPMEETSLPAAGGSRGNILRIATLAATLVILSGLLVYQWNRYGLSVSQVRVEVSNLAEPALEKVREWTKNISFPDIREVFKRPATVTEQKPVPAVKQEKPAPLVVENAKEELPAAVTEPIVMEEKKESVPAKAEPTVTEAKPPAGSYYIVIGAFRDAANAQKMLRRAASNGDLAAVLNPGQSVQKIGIGGFATENEAISHLEDCKAKYNKEAWVFRK